MRARAKLRDLVGEEKAVEPRTYAIRSDDVYQDERRVAVSMSSETDDIRFFGVPQILLHERSAVDLNPLRETGAVLFNHNPDKIVGRPENVRLEDGRLRADIVFDEDDEAQRIFEKVKSGSLRGVSVGFKVKKWQRVQEGESWKSPSGKTFEGPADVATKWHPLEFSLTPIPADAAVGVGRAQPGVSPHSEEFHMDEKLREALVKRGLDPNATDAEAQAFMLRTLDPPETPKPGEPADPDPEPTENQKRLDAELATRERQRSVEMAELLAGWPAYTSLITQCMRDGLPVDATRKEVLARVQRDRPAREPVARVEFGEDSRDKFRRAMSDSFLLRSNRLVKEKEETDSAFSVRRQMARDICTRHFVESMKLSLRNNGLSDRGSDEELIARAFTNSTSDFADILKDAAFKRLLQAYQESPSTWRPLVRVTSAQDFKTLNRPKLGNMGSLRLTPELVPMAEGSTLDINESFAISNYTMSFGISRQAIVNDDLSAFDRIPTELGNAAARTVADTFFNLLISASGVGPTMAEDSAALFATTHTSGANYIASTGSPDVTGLGALKLLMRKQKGLVAATETAPILNITARHLLVPAALETVAQQTLNSVADPAKSNSITFNPFNNLNLIVEPRLDAGTNGATAFYLVADPNQVEGAEVAFLNGNDQPTMTTIQGTKVQGVQWGVSLDFGAKFIEHRGWARTRGA